MVKKGNKNPIPEEKVEQYLGRINIDTPRMRRLAKKVRKFRDYEDLNDLRKLQKINVSPEININKEDFHTLDNAFDEYKKSDEFEDKELELQSKVQNENDKFKKVVKDAAYKKTLDLYTVNELLNQLDYGERPSKALSRVVAPSYFNSQDRSNLNLNKLKIRDFLSKYAQENESFRDAHNTLSDFQSGETFKDSNNTEEQEKYMQLYTDNLEKDVKDTVDYFNALYSTKRARRGVRRIDKYAEKIIQGNPEQYNYDSMDGMNIRNINVQNESSHIGKFERPNVIIGSIGDKRHTRKGTLAHEIAHGRRPFNYKNYKKEGKNEDSPYYNDDYSIIRKKHKRWLKPEVPWKMKEENPEGYKHDVELSEAFSDLAELRQVLYDAGIADGTKRRYRNKDIKALRKSSEFDSRYLDYHSNNNRVRKALNRIWADGGDMSNGENIESGPIDGGVLEAAVVTQDNDFNKFLATLPANQRETPEDKYHTYKMWKIAGQPKDFQQALDMGLYHWNNKDKSYHGNSVIYDKESDVYHFLKPKDHSTLQYELDWFNKGVGTDDEGNQYELTGRDRAEWEDFRRNYYLDSSGDDYAYRRIPELVVPRQAQEKIMNALSEGVKAALQSNINSINQSLQEQKKSFANGGRILDGTSENNQTLSNTPETHYLTMQEAADISHNNNYAFMHPYSQDGSEALLYPEELEQATVTAFKSPQEANVYYGDQFGKNVVTKGVGEAGQFIFNNVIEPAGNVIAPLGYGIAAAKAYSNFKQGNYADGFSSVIDAIPGADNLKTGYKYVDKGLEVVDALKSAKQFSQVLTLSDGGRVNRFDDGGNTSSTETTSQKVEESTSSNPYEYSSLKSKYGYRDAIRKHIKQFYVTDENGNPVKDADGKAIPNTLGNILKTQLQPLKDMEGKDHYSHGSPIGESNRGTQPTSSAAIQFLKNWYNSQATIDIIQKEAKAYKTNVFESIPYTDENGNTAMYTPTPEEAVALRSALASEVPEYKDIPMKDNTLAFYMPHSKITTAPSLSGKVFGTVPDKNGDGEIMYLGPSIQYGDNESEESGSWVPLHELNHAFQHQLLPSYYRDRSFGLEHDDLKSEQHSYLMALRAALGLNPEKRDYTKEDAQQMIDALQDVPDGDAGPTRLLKIINNNAGVLAHMLNTWAAAETKEEKLERLGLVTNEDGELVSKDWLDVIPGMRNYKANYANV